jgi:hypothetical protein
VLLLLLLLVLVLRTQLRLRRLLLLLLLLALPGLAWALRRRESGRPSGRRGAPLHALRRAGAQV